MAMSFGVILAIPKGRLDEVFNRTHQSLSECGFAAVSEVYRLGSDESGDITILDADDTDEPCLISNIRETAALKTALAHWQGMLLVYSRPDVTIEVGVTVSSANFSNLFLRIPERFIELLFSLNDIERLYRLLAQLAAGVGAEAGIGDIELEPTELAPQQMVHRIAERPNSHSVSLGIVAISALSEQEVHQLANDRFTVRRLSEGYWLLEEHDFREVYNVGPTKGRIKGAGSRSKG